MSTTRSGTKYTEEPEVEQEEFMSLAERPNVVGSENVDVDINSMNENESNKDNTRKSHKNDSVSINSQESLELLVPEYRLPDGHRDKRGKAPEGVPVITKIYQNMPFYRIINYVKPIINF